MHQIKLDDRKFSGPSSWKDLDADGLVNVALYTNAAKQSAMVPYYLIIALFKIPMKLYLQLIDVQTVQLLPLIQWIYTKNDIQKWLIKKIYCRRANWYGPADRLADMTAEEFMYAEGAYERWLLYKKPEYLDALISVLYRPKAWWRKKRDRFNPDELPSIEKRLGKLRHHFKQAIALNYAGCRNLIISRHPNVWKKYDPDEHPDRLQARPGTTTNWAGLILDIAGDKFGTYEQTIKINVWLLLADMDKKAKTADELNKKYKRK